MKGTIIKNIKLTKAVDGDTIKILLNDKEGSIRFACLDTEESQHGRDKPVTNAGSLASKWVKAYFGTTEEGIPSGNIRMDIEFDTNDPEQVCRRKHRDNYGRLLCYVYKAGTQESSNLRIVEEGWSPYFVKYGRSRLYHLQFMEAESKAQSAGVAIWNPATNAGGEKRDYTALVPCWHFRDGVVQDYRTLGIQAGSTFHKFNLRIPNRDSAASQAALRLIETRYGGQRRNYVYVTGHASLYPPSVQGKPQVVISATDQLKDFPPS